MMARYVKKSWMDWLLCLCVNASLTAVFCSGFLLEGPLAAQPLWAFPLAAVFMAVLFLLAYRRWLTVAGIAAGAVLAVLAALYIRQAGVLEDEGTHSAFLFCLILILSGLLAFLLARTRAGSIVLFLLGILAAACAHFLQFPVPLWSFLLFTICVFALFFYRVYIQAMLSVQIGRVRIGAYMRQTAFLCLIGFALAAGLYAGVVRPMSPPTQELLLITRLQSMDVLEVLGISNTRVVTDPDLFSNTKPDRLDFSGEQDEQPDDSLDDASPELPDEAQPDLDSAVLSESPEEYSAVRYWTQEHRWIWPVVAVVLLVIAAFVLRLLFRRRWRARVRSLPPETAAVNYYRWFCKRLRRAGLKKDGAHTLREYASHHALQLEPFDSGESSFANLTRLYERVLYGGGTVTPEEYQLFEDFYDRFPRALRRELGGVKYCLQIFRF